MVNLSFEYRSSFGDFYYKGGGGGGGGDHLILAIPQGDHKNFTHTAGDH